MDKTENKINRVFSRYVDINLLRDLKKLRKFQKRAWKIQEKATQ